MDPRLLSKFLGKIALAKKMEIQAITKVIY